MLSKNPFQQHLDSKKHKDAVRKSGRPEDISESLEPARVCSIANPTQITASVPSGAARDAAKASDEEGGKEEEEDEAGDDDDVVEVSALHCVFCPSRFSDFDTNLRHMLRVHSFFVPDVEYLCDAEGLIAYLNEKVRIAPHVVGS